MKQFESQLEYNRWAEKYRDEWDKFLNDKLICVFAFTEEEFKRKLKEEYNLEPNDIVGAGSGAYFRIEDVKAVQEFSTKKSKEKARINLLNFEYALTTALWDLEYGCGLTSTDELWDYMHLTKTEIIDAGITEKEINKIIDDYMVKFNDLF